MLGDNPIDRRINRKWMTRVWVLRHPYYNYRHAPSSADPYEYLQRYSQIPGDCSYLLN